MVGQKRELVAFSISTWKRKEKLSPQHFKSVCLNDKQTAEETLGINSILYDVDTVDG